jgi:hypothetical protein
MPTGIILAYSVPDGAQVLIDGSVTPSMFGFARTPAIISEVAAGTRNVTFRLPGYTEVTIPTSVPQGGSSTVTAILIPTKRPT